MDSVGPLEVKRHMQWLPILVTSAWGGSGALVADTTDSVSVMLRSIDAFPFEYQVDGGPWTRIEYLKSMQLNISLATSQIRLRKSEFGGATLVRLEIESLTNEISTDGEPVDIGAAVFLDAVQTFTKAQTVAPGTLVSGPTVTPDSSISNTLSLVVDQAFTLANATNTAACRAMNIEITQDGTGGHLITYGSEYLFPADANSALSTGAGARDYLSCVRDSANATWLCSLSKTFG